MKVLQVLARSRLASKEELSIFDAALIDPLERSLRRLEDFPETEDNKISEHERESENEHDDASGEAP